MNNFFIQQVLSGTARVEDMERFLKVSEAEMEMCGAYTPHTAIHIRRRVRAFRKLVKAEIARKKLLEEAQAVFREDFDREKDEVSFKTLHAHLDRRSKCLRSVLAIGDSI